MNDIYHGEDISDKAWIPEESEYISPDQLKNCIQHMASIISGIGAPEEDTQIMISLIELQVARVKLLESEARCREAGQAIIGELSKIKDGEADPFAEADQISSIIIDIVVRGN